MIVLDTHALVFYLNESKPLGKAARRAIEKAPRIGVAATTLLELTLLVERRRLVLKPDPLAWMTSALSQPRFELLPLTPYVASTAYQLRGALSGDPADRIIAATAVVHGCPLVTRDTRIIESGVVPTIW
ncbi:MAG: type II toxin-antitoxin system VapC family toxin [Polyangiaceae bacterium]